MPLPVYTTNEIVELSNRVDRVLTEARVPDDVKVTALAFSLMALLDADNSVTLSAAVRDVILPLGRLLHVQIDVCESGCALPAESRVQ